MSSNHIYWSRWTYRLAKHQNTISNSKHPNNQMSLSLPLKICKGSLVVALSPRLNSNSFSKNLTANEEICSSRRMARFCQTDNRVSITNDQITKYILQRQRRIFVLSAKNQRVMRQSGRRLDQSMRLDRKMEKSCICMNFAPFGPRKSSLMMAINLPI